MKKIFGIMIMLLVLVTMPVLNISVAANLTPYVSIYAPSTGVVRVGGTVSYRIVSSNATSFVVTPSDVGLARGISANISVQNVSGNEKIIVLSNVTGNIGASGYIAIKAGVAKNGSLSSKTTPVSPAFTIIEAEVPPAPQEPESQPSAPSVPEQTQPSTTPSTPTQQEPEPENPSEPPKEKEPEIKDDENPSISISKASRSSVKANGEVTYTVDYIDNIGIENITLSEKDITLYGFTAKVSISGEGNSRKITLSNINGELGGLKYIVIAKGTASDKVGNTVDKELKSGYFKLVDNTTSSKPDDWVTNPNTGK